MSEIWRPSPARIANSNLTRFMRCVNARRGLGLRDYAGLYAWSIDRPVDFWSELARFADVRAEWGSGPVLEHAARMPGARFFPQARLNFAANLLKFADDRPALVFRNERGTRRTLSYRELRAEVARIADGLRSASSRAISSKGLMESFTPPSSTPEPSFFTWMRTEKSTTRLMPTRIFISGPRWKLIGSGN